MKLEIDDFLLLSLQERERITSLDFAFQGISDLSDKNVFFAALGECKNLKSLDVEETDLDSLDEADLKAFYQSISNCLLLESINLSRIYFASENHVRFLSETLPLFPKLKKLVLRDNELWEIIDEYLVLLAQMLPKCKALEYIDLSGSGLGNLNPQQLKLFFAAIKQCKKLVEVNFSFNGVGDLTLEDVRVLD